MANKPVTPAQPAQANTLTVTVPKIIPAVDADGKRISEKWDCIEVTVTGVVTKQVTHEKAQPLAVARERWQVLTNRRIDKGEPEKW